MKEKVKRIEMKRLKEIIDETVSEYLGEGAALCHDEKGHFSACKPGATYSLSDEGAEEGGVDKKYVARGKVGKKGKKEDGTYSVVAKFGMNTSKEKQAGRKKMPDGEDISPKYSVSDYPKRYSEGKRKWDPDWKSSKKRKSDHEIMKPSHSSWTAGAEELSQVARGVGLGLFEGEAVIDFQTLRRIIEEALPMDTMGERRSDLYKRCRAEGLVTTGEAQKRILASLNAFAKAQDGKLNEPQS